MFYILDSLLLYYEMMEPSMEDVDYVIERKPYKTYLLSVCMCSEDFYSRYVTLPQN